MTEKDKCKCHHFRESHGESDSINYTEGKCTKCKCEHFVIQRVYRQPEIGAWKDVLR